MNEVVEVKKVILIFTALFIATGCSAVTTSTVKSSEITSITAISATQENTEETTDGRSGLIRDLQRGWWEKYDSRKFDLQTAYNSGEITELEYLNALLALEEEYYGWCSDEYNAVYALIEQLKNQ